jgi:hypothetical protein
MSDTPSKAPDQAAQPPHPAERPKMRRPNRLRGRNAPPAAPTARQAGFVPKLLAEILPAAERDALPVEVQELFVQGYNYGLEEYGDPERALHLGWAAVHRHFDQVGKTWVAKPAAAHAAAAPPHGDPDVAQRLRRLHNR